MTSYLEYGEWREDDFNRYFDEYDDRPYEPDEQELQEPNFCAMNGHTWHTVYISGCECDECLVCGACDC